MHTLKLTYHYVQMLISDEVSMTGGETFDDSDRMLRLITEKDLPLGGISTLFCGHPLVVGDFV